MLSRSQSKSASANYHKEATMNTSHVVLHSPKQGYQVVTYSTPDVEMTLDTQHPVGSALKEWKVMAHFDSRAAADSWILATKGDE